MVRDVKEVLKAMGWVEGFAMPISSAENQKLEEEIEMLLHQKAESVVKFEIAKDRLTALQRNEKQFEEEKTSNQNLMQALRKNLDSEILSVRNCETDYSQMNYDMKQMDAEMKATGNRIDYAKSDIDKFTSELDHLRKVLEWEDEALFAWEEELAKREHHNDVLKNLELNDFDKFNELELKRQMLQGDLMNQQQAEHNEVDLMLRTQATLQAQSNSLDEIRKNRSKLMKRWYEASKLLETRKSQVQHLENAASELKIETEELIESTEPIQRRAEHQKKENALMRSGVDKFKSRYKQEEEMIVERKKAIDHLSDELYNMEKETNDQNSKNSLLKSKIKELQDTIKSRKEKAERINTVCLKLKSKLDTINIKLMTDEQKHKNADEIYEIGLKVLKEEERELERLTNTTSGLVHEQNKLRNEDKMLKNDLDLVKIEVKTLAQELTDAKVDVQNMKQDIQLKEEDNTFLMQKLKEMLEEDLSSEMQKKFTQECSNIQMSIQSQKREQTTLRIEIKNLRQELRELNRVLNKGRQELENLGTKSTELKLKMMGGSKLLREAQEQQNRTILDLNLVKMQVNAAKDGYKKIEDNMNNYERKKVIIESALQERSMDLKSHREQLVTRKKLLQEERTNLKKSVDHLNQRIKQVNNRYEIIMDMMKDENGETNSVAYFQIKVAQEKRELIEQGDELQAKVEKTEKEILAMENTLRLVNCTNENFKSNLDAVELNGPEMQEFDRIEAEYHQEHEQYLSNTRMVQDMTKAINKTKASIASIQETGVEVEKQWKEKEKDIELLTKSLATKQAKLGTATKVLTKMMSDVKNSKSASAYRHTLKDIETRITAEQNKSALSQLAEFTQNYLEARPVVNVLLGENGISLADNVPAKLVVGSKSTTASTAGSGISFGLDRDVDQFKGSDVSLSPSVVNLDPTLLIPSERHRPLKDYSSRCTK